MAVIMVPMLKKHSTGIVVSCATGLDRLGHGEMLQNVIVSFRALCPDCEIQSYALAVVDRHSVQIPDVTPIKLDRISGFFTVENKKRIHSQLGKIGLLIFYVLRFYAITKYYRRLHKLSPGNSVIIDLEYEPIQSAAARILAPWKKLPNSVSVVHSFYNGQSSGLKKLYKALSSVLIRRHVRAGNILGVMTPADFERALAAGIEPNQVVLVGWGLDNHANEQEVVHADCLGDRVNFVSAGVLRQDKRIDQLIRYFAAIDDPRINLKIAGAPIDVDVTALANNVANSSTKTSITLDARYFANEEFVELFNDAHVIVLSHDSGFQSMSGPLLAALQLKKPILCFSGHNVARIVTELSAGIVANLDEPITEGLRTELRELKNRKYILPEDFPYSWVSICRRLKHSIANHWPEVELS